MRNSLLQIAVAWYAELYYCRLLQIVEVSTVMWCIKVRNVTARRGLRCESTDFPDHLGRGAQLHCEQAL